MTNIITFHAAAMKRAMAFCAQIVERRNMIPVLGNVLIEAEGPWIKVSATDLDIMGVMEIEAADFITKPIRFTIGTRLFEHFVRNTEGKVTMTISGETAKIEGDGMEMEVRFLIPADDFPIMQIDPMQTGTSIPEATLRKALWSIRSSIGTEETRYYLNGSFLHQRDGQLVAVATDGHRLSMYQPKIDWNLQPAIIPTKAVDLLISNMDASTNRQIAVVQAGMKMQFKNDNWTITTKTIDGTYPDYARVIPKPADQFQTALSLASLRRLPATGFHVRAVAIHPDIGKMTLDDQSEVKFTLPITGKGGPVGFNARYLTAFAKLFGTIRLTGAGAGDPALVHVEDAAFTGVIMPMRV